MRTWTRLVPAVLLAVPFTLAPIRADAELETADQKIARMQKEMDALHQKVDRLQDEVRNIGARGAKTAEDIGAIKELLRQMASTQETIRRYAPPPPDAVPGAAAPTTATITVRNQYTSDATIHINGRPYMAPAGRDVRIGNVPLGPINYDVDVEGYGIVQPLRTETLRPNGRIITIFPQYGG